MTLRCAGRRSQRKVQVTFIILLLSGLGLTMPSLSEAIDPGTQAAKAYRNEKLAHTRGGKFVCGTAINGSLQARYEEEWLRHERNLQRLQRLRTQADQPQKAAQQVDIGDIAVIEDDGSLVMPANPYDLDRTTLRFTPAPEGGYVVSKTEMDYDRDLGDKVTSFRGSSAPEDDGYAEVSFNDGFTFPLGDREYERMFIGTNGYLSFARGDALASPTVRTFLLLPRIAAFWGDLDVTGLGSSATFGIFVNQFPDRVMVTYQNVPLFNTRLFNTFQVSIFDTGEIWMNYLRVRASSGLVGVSPGRATQQNVIDLTDPPEEALGDAIFEVFRSLAELDVFGVPSTFYQSHADDFDFVYIWTDFPFDLGGAFAFYSGTRNEAEGIGLNRFDRSGSFGSDGRLQGILALNNIVNSYPESPAARFLGLNSALSILGQEQGHRWLSFIRYPGSDPTLLLGRQRAHWSFFFNAESSSAFSSGETPRSSSEEGNVWIDHGDGSFSTPASQFIDGFSELDQYLIGLRGPAEVSDSFVIVNPETEISRSAAPRARVTVRGQRQDVTIGEIIQGNGPRVPSVDESQKEWRAAFILVTQQGNPPSQATLDKLNLYRTAWETYFAQATDQRGRIDTRLAN